ncbi:Nodulation efficiency protein NfeD [Malonomonas rubra DSM 5091]|uniref:Nodulation efficiency protein NfeD n=1 Tax=Malonomonas rubra DSM 5091 TaxID=1122189 RepID=A0A1M6FA03_MALRU|nr:nodulation protein NfeD [Malonomonas rubra]SHI94439.1 Nodulation efficiency protein NfeD [Malonomonas rubra DSM 5091]
MHHKLAILTIFLCGLLLSTSGRSAPNEIRQLQIAASINPVTANFIIEQIEQANRENDRAILIQLDTPGGLDSAMREIIQAQLNSRAPVIVYVAPQGARAASAGAFITIAADFAAMAPGTNIGAAHPVNLGGGGQAEGAMADKATNDAAAYARSLAEQRGRNPDWAEKAVRESDSISAATALEQQVVDFVAESTGDLLKQIDGLTYLRNGQKMTLITSDAQLVTVEMTWRQKVLNSIANPNIAYLLMMLGILGIFFEISQPGVILPGVIGAVAILLAFFGLSALPVNYVGVLLILLAFVLFILEVKVVSYGMLSVCGVIAMAFGSLMLIDSSEPYLQISRALIAATVTVSAGFFLFAVSMVVRTQKRPAVSGQEGMIGEIGTVVKAIHGRGSVFVHGEYWQAQAEEPIPEGTEIEVTGMARGLELKVKSRENLQTKKTMED